jgi:hypothetical protein
MSCFVYYIADPVLNCSAMSITDENGGYVFNFDISNQRNLKSITIFSNSTGKNTTSSFPMGKNKLDLDLDPGIFYNFFITAEGPGKLITAHPCIRHHHTGK